MMEIATFKPATASEMPRSFPNHDIMKLAQPSQLLMKLVPHCGTDCTFCTVFRFCPTLKRWIQPHPKTALLGYLDQTRWLAHYTLICDNLK